MFLRATKGAHRRTLLASYNTLELAGHVVCQDVLKIFAECRLLPKNWNDKLCLI